MCYYHFFVALLLFTNICSYLTSFKPKPFHAMNKSKYLMILNENVLENVTLRDEIAAIIGTYLSFDEITLKQKGLNCVPYSILLEKSYILCKGRLYEGIMDELMQTSSSSDDTRRIGCCLLFPHVPL